MNSVITAARKLYVDSNVIICFIEGDQESQRLAEKLFEQAEMAGIELVTSEIAIGECLYGAHKRGRHDSVARFETLFEDVALFRLIPIETETVKQAARLGAACGMKLIDAIHVASAIGAECDALVTNDRGIKPTEALRVVQLPDV
ncbi:putative nucleic acid-binding protein [Azospirillum fermentarium]|uniref:type II toxin-antitoxin system VapC family toxin n=1 Tax=Azospirillum fermentarium TaxID=1233114 RepID=UPI0022273FA6|nr:type II toxin-antitoxin system VapC family toxin [Azospirillum fermentarium]MCW2245513.1 putative nucleic acid-binding protein [Azospirillum fermentarium]